VNTNGENVLFWVVQDSIQESQVGMDPLEVDHAVRSATTAFYARFYFWVNCLALLSQAFFASRLLRFGGLGLLFLMQPILAMVSYGVMAWVPILAVIGVAKTLENATNYSFSNTARHVFWLPFSRDVSFQAKPTIDSMFTRFGDGMAALTVLVGVQAIGLPLIGFIGFNLVLIVVWLGAALVTIRLHRRVAPAAKQGRISNALMGPPSDAEEAA
jgi:AAA family ATP:ADP antiporter